MDTIYTVQLVINTLGNIITEIYFIVNEKLVITVVDSADKLKLNERRVYKGADVRDFSM